ncbi:MAG: hypothetical protein ACN6OS_21945 [Comamonas testosteroni]|uniref:hypothetical protein n=1 Tax=Comamonas testosteroni TaxID=285 RepID=UPI003D0F3ED6
MNAKQNYSTFGHPTLLDVRPTAIEDNKVKNAMDSHMDALVSFIVERPYYDRRRCVIGSGFFVSSYDPTVAVLCTAEHVVDQFVENGFGWITVGTAMIELRDVGLRKIDKKLDAAFWIIPSNLLIAHGITGLTTLPLFDHSYLTRTFDPTCSFAIFGYPASKNKEIDMRDGGDRGRNLLGIAFHGFQCDIKTQEICFFYPGKGIPEAWAHPQTTSVKLDGMSGGPCVQFMVDKETRALAIVVVGVFCRWQGKRELRATALDSQWFINYASMAPE